MTIHEQTIRSLGELIDAVTPLEPDPETGRRRDIGVYHGSSSARHHLLTSLDRLGGTAPPHTKVHLESHILRNFARYSRPHLTAATVDDWELLVIAQHHGVPTRLLDWSYSPLVAAHFATCRTTPATDCAVWRLDWQEIHRAFRLPPLSLRIEDIRKEEMLGSGNFTIWDLFADEAPTFACLIEPPSLDARIVAQSAAFTICSTTSKSFNAFLDAAGLSDALTQLIIPADSVQHVRDQLDLAGVEERRLFPDLDGVAASIRRYYG